MLDGQDQLALRWQLENLSLQGLARGELETVEAVVSWCIRGVICYGLRSLSPESLCSLDSNGI